MDDFFNSEVIIAGLLCAGSLHWDITVNIVTDAQIKIYLFMLLTVP